MASLWLPVTVLGACCLALAATAQAKDRPLPITEDRWVRKVFPPEGVPEQEAAVLEITSDTQQGPCLSVGPWRQGEYSARFQWASPLPFTMGTLRGHYRTEDVPVYGATVTIEFHAKGERCGAKHFSLPPADTWTPFSYRVRTAPPGAEAISPGLGLASHTEGKVQFAGLTFSPEAAPLDPPADPGPLTRPAPAGDFTATGFYHVEEHGGAWCLVTPEGTACYSLGTDGPWLSREENWKEEGRAAARQLRDWGFNSLAGWTNVRRWGPIDDELAAAGQPPLAMFATIQTGTWKDRCDQLVDDRGRNTGRDHAFPDPFDPRFEQAYRESAHRIAEVVHGKPWFAGYFADNEVSHRDLWRYLYSPHCAAAFRAFLRARYADAAALSKAWEVPVASFDELPAGRFEPVVRAGARYDDYRAFAREMVARYIDTTIRVIREEDPDHLVISNRFMLDDVGAWMDYLDLYSRYDVVSVNLYPANQEVGLSEAEQAIYRLAHEKSGRPILVGEWSIPAVDSGLYTGPQLDWSWNEVLETQTQRARQAACVTRDFYDLPFVIGSHWFIWGDIDNEKRRANRGLVRADGRPWEELTRALTRINQRIAAAQER
jgi:hypothetical protein